LKEVTDKLQALSDNPQAVFEPLKRLALHISEHMVLAELNAAPAKPLSAWYSVAWMKSIYTVNPKW
jgi:hypothetical protein